MSEPQPLGFALDRFLAHLGAPPASTVSALQAHWGDIVGPALADHTRPVGCVAGVLTVRCDDAAWASQIRWMDTQIKQHFARQFAGIDLRSIKVLTGS